MITLIFNIVYMVIAMAAGLVCAAIRWIRLTAASVKDDRRNLFKLIAVPALCFYAATRICLIHEMITGNVQKTFTENEMTQARKERAERYASIQKSTLFIDRYRNAIVSLSEDDRQNTATGLFILTCSRRFQPICEHAWNYHCMELLKEGDQNKIDRYLKKVRWMTDKEKTERIITLKQKINENIS